MLQLEVIGNLGSDAEIKEFGGNKYVSLSVAHSEKRKDGTEATIWVSVLMHGEGGSLLQYLKKGVKVFVRGRLVPKAYIDKQGQAQCAVNMYSSEINLCGGKSEGAIANAQQSPTATAAPSNDLPF